jgi:hypothetical protein
MSNVSDALREFRAPRTMTPDELGDSLARLVWESFSDFVAESEPEITLPDLLATSRAEVREQAAEEALVFFMWAHTRGTQLAFIGRANDELVREGLDLMHGAIFDDMVLHGTPASQLPIFEQRVGARYAEYAAAAELSNARLGRAVVRHLTGAQAVADAAVRAVVERAIAVANPLRDFLEDVELIAEAPDRERLPRAT